jgi:hypothetical protein
MASTPPPDLSISKNENLTIQNKNISTKTAYFKFGTSTATTDSIMEVITKEPDQLEVTDQIVMSGDENYYITNIDKTEVKFASGTPLVTQKTNIRFPTPETKQYAPEKVATFLIFKK